MRRIIVVIFCDLHAGGVAHDRAATVAALLVARLRLNPHSFQFIHCLSDEGVREGLLGVQSSVDLPFRAFLYVK